MKKFLLSTVAVATMGIDNAATVTLESKDATDIQGTYVEEVPAAGTSNGQAAHYQPLTSLKIGDYSFTFTTTSTEANSAPAYYYAMSTSTNPKLTIRTYAGTTMTITAPAGESMATIKFSGSNADTNLAVSASEGVATRSSNTINWEGKGKVNSVSFSFTGKYRINSVEITTGEGSAVEPPVVENPEFVKVANVTSGKKYVFVAENAVSNGQLNQGGGKYGYIQVDKTVTIENDAVKVPANYALTFTAVDGGYNIQNAAGSYFIMTGTYNSFNADASNAAGAVWTVTPQADGTVIITNVEKSKSIMYAPNYSSYGSYASLGSNVYPTLYEMKEGASAITDITVDENAPVEYYNLQGLKVQNPENGLYIRRQGKSVTKIYVK